MYWVRRLREGSWTPNRHLSNEGYYGRATKLGVWIWESNEVIYPIHDIRMYGAPGGYCLSMTSALRTLPNSPHTVQYWAELSKATRPEPWDMDIVDQIYGWWLDWRSREQRRTWDRLAAREALFGKEGIRLAADLIDPQVKP